MRNAGRPCDPGDELPFAAKALAFEVKLDRSMKQFQGYAQLSNKLRSSTYFLRGSFGLHNHPIKGANSTKLTNRIYKNTAVYGGLHGISRALGFRRDAAFLLEDAFHRVPATEFVEVWGQNLPEDAELTLQRRRCS